MYDFPENGTEKKNKIMKRKENWRKIPSHSCDCYFFPPFFFISILLNVTKKMLSVCHTLIKPFSRIILFSFSFVFFFIYSPRCCCCFSGKLIYVQDYHKNKFEYTREFCGREKRMNIVIWRFFCSATKIVLWKIEKE